LYGRRARAQKRRAHNDRRSRRNGAGLADHRVGRNEKVPCGSLGHGQAGPDSKRHPARCRATPQAALCASWGAEPYPCNGGQCPMIAPVEAAWKQAGVAVSLATGDEGRITARVAPSDLERAVTVAIRALAAAGWR